MYYDKIAFPSTRFPICVLADYDSAASRDRFTADSLSYHEQIEILYFLEGVTALVVKDKTYMCTAGDVAVINPYELHTLYRKEGHVRYHCIMIDSLIYRASNDITNEKYVDPLDSRSVVFRNLINDEQIAECLKTLVREMTEKQPAYELAVKAQVYMILTELNRRFVCKELSKKEDEPQHRIHPRARRRGHIALGDIREPLAERIPFFAHVQKTDGRHGVRIYRTTAHGNGKVAS